MSNMLDRLRELSDAEEFFSLLGVSYEPEVLDVARLHILRRMGQYLSEETFTTLSDGAAEQACRATLVKVYSDFQGSSPLQHRVFKVLQDAVAPGRRAFVPLSDIEDEG